MISFRSWLSGFVDGEGSFLINIYKHAKMMYGIGIKPEFVINMHKKDGPVLGIIQKNLGMGKVSEKFKEFIKFKGEGA